MAAALTAPADRLKHRIFFAATGEKLVTASEAAALVREMIPGADVSIAPELDEYDEIDMPFRGLLDVKPVKDQLAYCHRYANLRDGVAEYIQTYSAYLRSQGVTPAKTVAP